MVPFWVPIIIRGLIRGPNLGDPKRDHDFDNPPFGVACRVTGLAVWGLSRPHRETKLQASVPKVSTFQEAHEV